MTNLFIFGIVAFLIERGAACTALGPITHVIDTFFHLVGERNDFVTASHEAIGIDIFFGFVGVEERGDDGLFDLGAREALGRCDDSWDIEIGDLTIFLNDMNFDNGFTLSGAGEIDEEYLVETTFTEEFRGQHGDVVSGCDNEDRASFFLKPGNEGTEDARAGTTVC